MTFFKICDTIEYVNQITTFIVEVNHLNSEEKVLSHM